MIGAMIYLPFDPIARLEAIRDLARLYLKYADLDFKIKFLEFAVELIR